MATAASSARTSPTSCAGSGGSRRSSAGRPPVRRGRLGGPGGPARPARRSGRLYYHCTRLHPGVGDDQRAGAVRRAADRTARRGRHHDAAPRGPVTFAMWEPPLTTLRGAADAPVRRAAIAETAGLLADLVADEVPALAFVRSRRGAEAVAAAAKRTLQEEGHGRAGQPGRRVPVRLPARGAARAGGGPAQRGDHRAGRHAPRSSWASTSPAWRRC